MNVTAVQSGSTRSSKTAEDGSEHASDAWDRDVSGCDGCRLPLQQSSKAGDYPATDVSPGMEAMPPSAMFGR